MRNLDARDARPLAPRPRRGARRGAIAAAAFIAVAAPAWAAPRTINDCEAIKDPNAYNLCLASFGPVRGQHGASYPGVASEGDRRGASSGTGGRPEKRQTAAPAGARSARRANGAGVTHGGGRIRMEFTPGR